MGKLNGLAGAAVASAMVVAAVVAGLAPGCSNAVAPKAEAPQSYSDIAVNTGDVGGLPEPADLAIDASQAGASWQGQYQAAVRVQGPWSGKLVVVLPDLTDPPGHYRELLREFARAGHHVLALPAAAAPAVSELCGANSACYDAVRSELWDGLDHSPKLTLTQADGVIARLVSGLQGLEKVYPGQNWGTYYSAAVPTWAKIRLVGHGEGASQAAWAAGKQLVERVVLLAGPVDGQGDDLPAWVNNGHLTPTAQWYGLCHTADPQWARIAKGWTALGLGAGPLSWPSIDQGAVLGVPFLTTAAASAQPRKAIAVDEALARDSQNRPVLRQTWRNLIGP